MAHFIFYNLIEIIAYLSLNGQNNKIESIERRKTMTPVSNGIYGKPCFNQVFIAASSIRELMEKFSYPF